jgi:hypothetical protein
MKLNYLFLFLLLAFAACAQTPDVSAALRYLQTYGKPPADYVTDQFKTHDVVILAEDHAIQQNLDFVAGLIPVLYAQGVRNIGMEFGASEMQSRLDSLLSANRYNEQQARDMMFYYNVGWAYRAYADIYRAAWQFNQTLPKGAPRFRVLNLSYQYDWSAYRGGQRTPENMSRVFYKGTPDKYRAEIVAREVMDKHQKVLMLVGLVHGYTKYKPCHLDFSSDNFCACDDNLLGNRLYKMFSDRVCSIVLHQAFQNMPNQAPYLVAPAGGLLDTLMRRNGNLPLGFDLGDTPPGRLPDRSAHALGYSNFTVGQIADGYIFLVPFDSMQGCAIDEHFFDGKTWEEIKHQMPDPDWRGNVASLEEFWKQIRGFVDMDLRYKELRSR